MSRWPDRDAEEGKRSVALSLSNAVFSKLIKMGRQSGQTPQRVAQGLFEDAYIAKCTGKTAAAQVAAAGDMADAIEDDLAQQLAEARAQLAKAEDARADLWRRCRELEGDRDVAKAAAAEAMDQVEHMVSVVAGKDRMLLDQADTIRQGKVDQAELSRKCWNAEAERDKLRAEVAELRETAKGQLVIVNQASAILKREDEKPLPSEPAWAAPSPAAQLRAIKAMRAANNSPAAIARQLGVSIETVRAALA